MSEVPEVTSSAAPGPLPVDADLVVQVFDELAAAVAVFSGPHHVVRAVNKAVFLLTGPGRDLVGLPFAEAFHELGDQRIAELLDRVYATGEPVQAQERRMLFDRRGTANLDEVFLSFSMHPTTVGSERGVIAHAVDVTGIVVARREAEAAADRSAERYRSAREVVWALQRSMLPARLPLLPRVRMAAHYLVAGDENAAGGDWFDAVALPDDRVAVMVGDVVGHGPDAAGVMGQLRAVMTQLLLDGWGIAEVIARLDRFAARVPAAAGSTVCLAVVDPAAATLEYASCGHPPPLVVAPGGWASYLELPGGGPLAVAGDPPEVASVPLRPGHLVMLYTDGLVERRRRAPRAGADMLREVVAHAGASSADPGSAEGDPVDLLCQAALEGMAGDGYDDDVSVLTLRLTDPTPPLHLELEAVLGSERAVRHRLHRWLSEVGVDEADALDLQLAVGEAVANVVEHAYPDGPGPVEVDVEHDRIGRVAVTVADRGRWRPHDAVARTGSGRGLAMMRETTDLCEIERTAEGTVVSMDRAVGVPTVLRLTAGIPSAGAEDGAEGADPRVGLRIVRNERSERAHLELDGWIDATAVAELRAQAIAACRGGAHPLTIDLEAVTGLASAGVQLLFELAELTPGGEPVELRASPRSAVMHVLEMVGLHRLVTPGARFR
ncbi:SpoIIE family protein phosphatase [Pseudonocardia lacus]|uniref:SpoIIE family protein phosphatase n=1 Tax=Pseudonocardia lacus TaxID=2835865 RepID=UPI001BDBDBE9|nr:SpoIIE family protein phosphatase [Pseudonocardia lacus]